MIFFKKDKIQSFVYSILPFVVKAIFGRVHMKLKAVAASGKELRSGKKNYFSFQRMSFGKFWIFP